MDLKKLMDCPNVPKTVVKLLAIFSLTGINYFLKENYFLLIPQNSVAFAIGYTRRGIREDKVAIYVIYKP